MTDILLAYLPHLARGATLTILIALLSFALAITIGALFAAVRLRRPRGLAWALVFAYGVVVKGVPDIVLVLIISVGGQEALNSAAAAAGFDRSPLSAFWAGVLALGLIYGAYLTETFRGAAQGVREGQAEAAKALGLGRWRTLRLVIAPQVLRLSLVPCANTWQLLLHSTALGSLIGLEEIVGVTGDAGQATRRPFLFYGIAMVFFVAVTLLSNRVVVRLARRLGKVRLRAD